VSARSWTHGEFSNPHRGCADECFGAAIRALKVVVPEISDRDIMLEAVAAVS
jgi:hypothetical protein